MIHQQVALYSAWLKITRMFLYDRTILVILARHCTRLPDDGSSVDRNMLQHFKYFILLIVCIYYILCISWIIKVFDYH